jgi:hypothetical protein
MVHYNEQEVKNIYEQPVEEHQIYGRVLLKAFTAAAAQARHNYGVSHLSKASYEFDFDQK